MHEIGLQARVLDTYFEEALRGKTFNVLDQYKLDGHHIYVIRVDSAYDDTPEYVRILSDFIDLIHPPAPPPPEDYSELAEVARAIEINDYGEAEYNTMFAHFTATPDPEFQSIKGKWFKCTVDHDKWFRVVPVSACYMIGYVVVDEDYNSHTPVRPSVRDLSVDASSMNVDLTKPLERKKTK